jgi:tRNA-Thr(GGU) m(6)t(6)A37 methyltransferase TsaA
LSAIRLQPIGIIHSPYTRAEDVPVQPVYARGIQGQAVVDPQYAEGLRDLDGFSHIHLLYHFHRAGPSRLLVKPFLDDASRGLFATRAPCRPNPIGMSLVKLVAVAENVLHLEDVDILDGTPLLDIKPFVTRFDHRDGACCGWQDRIGEVTARERGTHRRPDCSP